MTDDPAHGETEELVQIGDLARRVGVRVDTLRAWERRYGLLSPRRSPGRFRLYSKQDEATVRAMLAEMERGFPPAQAAKLARARFRPAGADRAAPQDTGVAGPGPGDTGARPAPVSPGPATLPTSARLPTARRDLFAALTGFRGERAHRMLDGLLAEFTLDSVLDEVILPCLVDIGEGWGRGEVTVAQEHFATNLLRERLLGLARPWDRGGGPRAVLACPPGERHDVALICFGVVLGRGGWRITFLGADTPVATVAEAARTLEPDLVVFASVMDGGFTGIAPALRALAGTRPVAIAGRAATPDLARWTGTALLPDSPVAAAHRLTSGADGRLFGPDGHRES
jgi:MerR family transcriptional regulator, light-induced transcriptional regulator